MRLVRCLYNDAVPVWCVMDGDRVLLCRRTKAEAVQELRDLKSESLAAGFPDLESEKGA